MWGRLGFAEFADLAARDGRETMAFHGWRLETSRYVCGVWGLLGIGVLGFGYAVGSFGEEG